MKNTGASIHASLCLQLCVPTLAVTLALARSLLLLRTTVGGSGRLLTYDKQQDFLMFLMYVFTLQLCPKNVQALSSPRAEGSPLLSDLCGGMIQQDAIEGKLA